MSNQELNAYEGKLIIGLTGNIATGKSAIMRLAADMGARTLDADKMVHQIMDTDASMQAAIAVAFGHGVRRADGRIDRNKLGEIVFKDPAALRDLEEMIHPAVQRMVDRSILQSKEPVIFIEAIKLLEGPLAGICHQIWVTRCTRAKQLERLRVCRGLETAVATERIKSQAPQEEKVARADVVIDTNGFMRETELQFRLVWQRLPDPTKIMPKARLAVPEEEEPMALEQAADGPADPLAKAGSAAKGSAPAFRPPQVDPLEAFPPRPDDVQVRRARPSDIPSILLLIQKATNGKKKMKRSQLLMALSERGYFIGQTGAEISVVFGYHLDSQVGRLDEVYIYPLDQALLTGAAVLEDVTKSAQMHMGQALFTFLPLDASEVILQLFRTAGFDFMPREELAKNWQLALDESQPEETQYLIKILRDVRIKK
jgi:dephospho-CoA kinase